MGLTGVLEPRQTRPDAKQPRPLGSRVFNPALLPQPVPRPAGLDHGRALGALVVKTPPLPTSLVRTRALGIPLAYKPFPPQLGLVRRTGYLRYDPRAHADSRPLFYLQAKEVGVSGLDHGRSLGLPIVAGRPSPVSIVRSRALGTPTVDTPLTPSPSSLVHARALGATVLSIGFPQAETPARTYWDRTLRGVRRRAPWD